MATKQFEKDLKRLSKHYKIIFDDLDPIVNSIKAGECTITLLTDASHFKAFKVRIANTFINKGKSGGQADLCPFRRKGANAFIALPQYSKQDVAFIIERELIKLISELSRCNYQHRTHDLVGKEINQVCLPARSARFLIPTLDH